jgi:hypothetical protein
MTSQRVMTSAISSMSVAEVRKGLQQVRNLWKNHSPDVPIDLSSTLFNGMTVQHFCFLLVLGQHVRRHHKCAASKKTLQKSIE